MPHWPQRMQSVRINSRRNQLNRRRQKNGFAMNVVCIMALETTNSAAETRTLAFAVIVKAMLRSAGKDVCS